MIGQFLSGVAGAVLIGLGMACFLVAAVPLTLGVLGGCAGLTAGSLLMVWAVGL